MVSHDDKFIVEYKNWNQILSHARYWRNFSRKGLDNTLHHFTVYSDEKSGKDYVLALGISGQLKKLYRGVLKSPKSDDCCSNLVLSPYLEDCSDACQILPLPKQSPELVERKRVPISRGISFYSYNSDNCSLLYSDLWNIFRKENNGEIRLVGSKVNGSPVYAECCPVDTSVTAFVVDSNVHIECNGAIIHSTKSRNGIINGIPSFISQEEFDRFTGIWWSPGPEKILLYERVDETHVTSLQFSSPGSIPPTPMKYPLAGTPNSRSSLHLVVIDHTVMEYDLAVDLSCKFPWYEYIARLGWTGNGDAIWAILLSRLQDQFELILIPMGTFYNSGSDVITLIHGSTDNWFNMHNLTHFLSTTDGSINFFYPTTSSDHVHLSLYTACVSNDGQLVLSESTVTQGNWSVCANVEIIVDAKRNHVYFLANKHHPTQANVCVAKYNVYCETKLLSQTQFSCRSESIDSRGWLNPDIGFVCWESSLKFPPRCSFYRLLDDDADGLPSAVFQYVLSIAGDISREMSLPFAVNHQMPELIEFESRNSAELHYALLLRPLNLSSGTCYPVLQFVYGGPCVQLVRNIWNLWPQLLVFTSLGYAVVIVDGRGSANRGLSFEVHIKHKLGTVEIEDQMEGLKEVAKRANGLLDLSRVAVKGWSYGGFLALMAIAKYPRVYRACIAGSGVTCWNLYDTAYTERYMGLPSSIYENASVLNFINQFPNEEDRLLLIHGLRDENVHFSHTQRLVEALIAAGKPYCLQVLPSEHHRIRSTKSSDFCDAMILSFLRKALL